LAKAGYTGGFSPGRTLGPVVSGPVDVGAGALLVVAEVRGGEDGDGVGRGSASPLVQAASNPAIAPIASNRKRTARSLQAHGLSTSHIGALWTTNGHPQRSR
jgi:hypothetical protein